jgi:hypothetical protein
MRPALVAGLVTLALPAAAFSQPRAASNGTLSIQEGRGVVHLDARGSMTGRVNGKLTVTDLRPFDAKRPVVYGSRKTVYRNARTTVYQGKNVRFRLGGARFVIRMEGKAIFLSAIARGTGTLDGAGNPEDNVFFDGSWSLNDEPYHSLPDDPTPIELVAPTTG